MPLERQGILMLCQPCKSGSAGRWFSHVTILATLTWETCSDKPPIVDIVDIYWLNWRFLIVNLPSDSLLSKHLSDLWLMEMVDLWISPVPRIG